ncbi:MAG TPA: DNA topoisomerase IV, partial [Bacteroidales bacterium]|nr:DNA topoisomerase IV [Bacteroidales bacterium]
ELGPAPEITRFKGLGEISPDEFRNFIGDSMRLDPVILRKSAEIPQILEFYMGRNTPDRQTFIVDNLRLEEDLVLTE